MRGARRKLSWRSGGHWPDGRTHSSRPVAQRFLPQEMLAPELRCLTAHELQRELVHALPAGLGAQNEGKARPE